jgi:hypothetical protein
MKQFLVKSGRFLLVFFLCMEIFSRLFIDPHYYSSINTYNVTSDKAHYLEFSKSKETEHVDYLFIGSSRVAATINPSIIMKKEPGVTAVVAGRGYMTEGIHYQALKNKISKYPDYLKNARVFIEYYGSDIYSGSFYENRLKVFETSETHEKAMPEYLLPHLNNRSLIDFLKESQNSISVKGKMIFLYYFSLCRTIPFVKEKFEQRVNRFNPQKPKPQLVKEGGIRDDNIEKARQWAVDIAAIQFRDIQRKPVLSFDDLNKSSLAFMNDLIGKNGGKLYLYKMPLSSVQEAAFKCEKARQNQIIFEKWISARGIPVVYNEKFKFQDSDFPDTWHLSADRRDEFTVLLLDEVLRIPLNHYSGYNTIQNVSSENQNFRFIEN